MTRALLVPGIALVFALCTFSQASAQLAKEGTLSGTYSAFGTFKATAIGKERLLVVFDDNGFTVGQGLADHMTHHCWGMGDFNNGVGQDRGYCVGMDPSGDQLVGNF